MVDDTELQKLLDSPALLHQVVFKSRHPDTTPPFHLDIIALWHSPAPRALAMAFREAGKSTIAEEAIALLAALKRFHNCVILGENQERAVDRLTAIKHEITTNELLIGLCGDLKDAGKWNEAKVILRNGVVIQALGRGQEVRGMKHLDWRPDFCFADDVEAREHVRDEHARKETLRWFFAEVLPALDKSARVRVNATPLDTLSLPMQLMRLENWVSRVYPIRYVDARGETRATWPERYPLEWIERRETEMRRLGLHHEFMREYMCQPDDPSKKVFTAGMFTVKPRVHVWQPCFAFYDPARTVKSSSSTTGWAVWSWFGAQLIVWDAGGERWLPSQMIEHIFKINEMYHPVMIGVEKEGLEEFIMQPVRQEMLKRGVILPLSPIRAPQNKLDFIGSLQPFLLSGEFSLAKDLPELVAQFLNFPTGQIDAPNALAYALKMRPGLPVYEDFGSQHVVETPLMHEHSPVWVTLNASPGLTTGLLVQLHEGRLSVFRDWMREGDPGAVVSEILKEARVETGREIRVVAPRKHFQAYEAVGLRGAAARVPVELRQGGAEPDGRAEIRSLLKQTVRSLAAFSVGHSARWTLNAFASGYAREIGRGGIVAPEPREGMYRTLLEGLESFAALMHFEPDGVEAPNYAWTEGGKRYITTRPDARREPQELKNEWGKVFTGRR
jgi:hypothetical protein